MENNRIKRFNENSELNIADVIGSFLKENLTIQISTRKCPHPEKCADDRRRLSNHYR